MLLLDGYKSKDFKNHVCGSALVSMRIQIQGAKPMRIRILNLNRLSIPILYVSTVTPYIIKKIPTYEGTKAFLNGWKSDLIVKFGKFPCSWIRIRKPNTNPDPGEPNQCGSGSTTNVAFLDKDLYDPYVFGPSGSVSQRYGSGFFCR